MKWSVSVTSRIRILRIQFRRQTHFGSLFAAFKAFTFAFSAQIYKAPSKITPPVFLKKILTSLFVYNLEDKKERLTTTKKGGTTGKIHFPYEERKHAGLRGEHYKAAASASCKEKSAAAALPVRDNYYLCIG